MSYAECFRNKWPNFGIVFYTIPQFGHLFLNTLYIRVTCVRVCDCVVACNCAIVCVQSRKCAWQWNETKLLIQFKGKTVKNSFSCTVRHLSIALRILLESLPKNVWRIGIRILIKYLRIKMFTSFFFFLHALTILHYSDLIYRVFMVSLKSRLFRSTAFIRRLCFFTQF